MMNVLVLIFLVLIPCASQLSFDFQSFSSDDTGTVFAEGEAYLGPGFLRLTKNPDDQQVKYGRATYKLPFLLQDHGEFTSFTTTFSFSIDSQKTANHGDGGLAFFVAPYASLLSSSVGAADGNTFGLPFNSSTNNKANNYEYPFVAVEFHICSKPNDDHVGIDVNSLNSLITAHWDEGKINTVSVRYDSSTKNLTVAYSTDVHPKTVSISYMVDLSKYLPDWVIVGFSASTGRDSTALHKIISWNFTSSLDEYQQKDEELVAMAAISAIRFPAPRRQIISVSVSDSSAGIVAIIVVIVIVVLALICCLFWMIRRWKRNCCCCDRNCCCCVYRGFFKASKLLVAVVIAIVLYIFNGVCFLIWIIKRRRKRNKDPISAIEKEFANGTGPKKFSYRELARATNNFAEEQKLGQGGFGGVYRGVLELSNLPVAVKRILEGSEQGVKEYAAEIRIISRLSHRNLVKLIGWCHENKKLLLVYELMPNGSLDTHLYKQQQLLVWDKRYNIAKGLASGLLYLHQGWEQCVLHRDIKSSNVMLDPGFNAKLGDFGLARLVDHDKESQTTIVVGTKGYMAMEYVITGKASKETDVYSFGVVLLEIACGRKPVDNMLEENRIVMLEWVWELYEQGKIMEAADPKLCGDFDEEQMECLLTVGLWCANPDYNSRPLIQHVIPVLNFEHPLPNLPSKMPVAFAPRTPVIFSSSSSSTTTNYHQSASIR